MFGRSEGIGREERLRKGEWKRFSEEAGRNRKYLFEREVRE